MSKLLKQYLQREVEGLLKARDGAIVVNYQGLSSAEEYAFRKALRQKNVRLKVVKASMVRVYCREHAFSGDIAGVLKGPVGLIVSSDAEGAVKAAKDVLEVVKGYSKVSVQGALYSGEVLAAKDVESLSRMPTREQLLGRLAGAFQAPTQGIANVLYQVNAQVASVFNALAKKREDEAGGAAA